jgi:hypothetical protein
MKKRMNKSVAATLATATCALLGTTTAAPVKAQEEHTWEFDTALLYYSEADDRVEDISLNILAQRNFLDDRVLSFGLAVDTLTGATPLGATPFDGAQTFTSPSGKKTHSTPPNVIPLDPSFLDTRFAVNANWQQPFGEVNTVNFGLSLSDEYDYTHMGANLTLSRDFNKRNTTASLGFSAARDDWSPVGGTPDPLTSMLDVGDLSNRLGDQSKDIFDVVVGVTQVVNQNLVAQLNYSYSNSSGYLNDPYKILSIVDPVTGDPIPRTPAPGVEGPSHEYLFEGRPDDRTKHSLYAKMKYYLSGKVLDISYRYMTDDWEIDSHTLDARFRWPIGDRSYLEPHFRYYTQSHADFYRVSLVNGDPLPAFASADYRLGEFDAITAGLKYGWETSAGHDVSVRLEYYMQDGDAPSDQIIGNQAQQGLYPDLDAIIFQFSYSFGL